MLRIINLRSWLLSTNKKYFGSLGKPSDEMSEEPNLARKTVKIKRQSPIEKYNLKKVDEKRKEYNIVSEQQKSYYGQISKKARERIYERNMQEKKYFKGEELIENIPTDPFYSYKVGDFLANIEFRKKELQVFFERKDQDVQEQQSQNNENFKNIVKSYEKKKEAFVFTKYTRYLEAYPGSNKGKDPTDDPQAFMEYANKEMPAAIKFFLQEYQNEEKKKIKPQSLILEQKQKEKEDVKRVNEVSSTFFLESDREMKVKVKKEFLTWMEDFPQVTNMKEIPFYPKSEYTDFQSWYMKLQDWLTFRRFYEKNTQYEDFKKFLLSSEKKIKPGEENGIVHWEEIEPSAPSLYPYYETLPKIVRQANVVRTVYLGLEYFQPDFSYEEKEDALNKAAYMALPMDEVSDEMMTKYTEERKFIPDSYYINEIRKIIPKYIFDCNKFNEHLNFLETKRPKEIKFQENIPQPEKTHLQTEVHNANLPVDYYENDDGFWDQIIEEKLNGYQKAKPMNRIRKHLIH